MQAQAPAPVTWVLSAIKELRWPAVVAGAFVLGRYVKDLEIRLRKAETNLEQLISRHMPAIHRALAEIRGLIMSKGH